MITKFVRKEVLAGKAYLLWICECGSAQAIKEDPYIEKVGCMACDKKLKKGRIITKEISAKSTG